MPSPSTPGPPSVSYYHLLLEGHGIVYSNGLPSESLLLADQSLAALSAAALAELGRVVGAAEMERMLGAPPAKPILRTRDALAMVA